MRLKTGSGMARMTAMIPAGSASMMIDWVDSSGTMARLPGGLARDAGQPVEPAGVELIEQPLPAGDDALLASIARPIPICADESLHDRAGLDALADRYDAINIKLDKAGGLTEALLLAQAAKARGLSIMVGCMLGTSLAMAPAMLLSGFADFVDLDGPLLLARDREPGLRFEGSLVHPPEPALWG